MTSSALLLALRRAAVVAAKAAHRGRPPPPHAERVLTCAPAALAYALRNACADDPTSAGDNSCAEELSATVSAVVDACAALEMVCSDAVVAAADTRLLPALAAMLSSRSWWERGGASAFGPERTAQLLTAVARAQDRADARRAVTEPAAPFGAAAAGTIDPSRDELIETLLAAQADMVARLHVMESGVERSSTRR